MTDSDWISFLEICRKTLGRGDWDPYLSDSWCAFTTFSSLRNGVHYWACGFPDEADLLASGTVDGGLWRQIFKYQDLAHVIVPASFYWERFDEGEFKTGWKNQNLSVLSANLKSAGIAHRQTDLIVEVKIY